MTHLQILQIIDKIMKSMGIYDTCYDTSLYIYATFKRPNL